MRSDMGEGLEVLTTARDGRRRPGGDRGRDAGRTLMERAGAGGGRRRPGALEPAPGRRALRPGQQRRRRLSWSPGCWQARGWPVRGALRWRARRRRRRRGAAARRLGRRDPRRCSRRARRRPSWSSTPCSARACPGRWTARARARVLRGRRGARACDRRRRPAAAACRATPASRSATRRLRRPDRHLPRQQAGPRAGARPQPVRRGGRSPTSAWAPPRRQPVRERAGALARRFPWPAADHATSTPAAG